MDKIPVLHEDEYFVALDKPAGLTVTRADSVKEQTLEDYLQEHFDWARVIDRGGIVHRLDKDTSGVILVAKSAEMIAELQRLFHDRFVQKTYVCLVHGTVKQDEGVIEGAVARNPKNRQKFAVVEDGRDSTTLYKVINRMKINPMKFLEERERITKKERAYYESYASEYSLVEAYPKTGRTHQIRVHMHYLGHPLVGDAVYTNRKLYRLDTMWCPRQFLHAKKIEFTHPKIGKLLQISSPLPVDLVAAITILQN